MVYGLWLMKNTLCNFVMDKIGVNVDHCVGSDHAPTYINSGDQLVQNFVGQMATFFRDLDIFPG